MQRFGMHPTAEEMQQMIADIDSDGSGTVSFEEFLVMVKQMAKEGEGGKNAGALSLAQIVERVRAYKEALDNRDFDALERMTA
jgi:hypothetical protein